MDKVLKDLKEHRELTELKFRSAIEALESEQKQILEQLSRLERTLDGESDQQEIQNILAEIRQMLSSYANNNSSVIKAFNEILLLQNARSAELARQLTVLPIERMDLVMDKFERQLEQLESKLARLEK